MTTTTTPTLAADAAGPIHYLFSRSDYSVRVAGYPSARPITIDRIAEDGRGTYCRQTANELRALGVDDLQILTAQQAVEDTEHFYITGPVEITRSVWDKALGQMPPIAWHVDGDAETFSWEEAIAYRVRRTYVRIGSRYFALTERQNRPRESIYAEVRALIEAEQPA